MQDTVETRMAKMLAQKYGNNSSTDDASSEMVAAASAMAGSVNTDKAVILGKEFDQLFGYTAPEPRGDNSSSQPKTNGGRRPKETEDLPLEMEISGDDDSNMEIDELREE